MFAYLDNKTNVFIQKLITYQSSVSISQMAKDLSCSRRVIYYHLDKINTLLKKTNVAQITNNNGLLLNTEQKEILKKFITENKQVSYILNPEERQLYIMFQIAMSTQRITLDRLMELLSISRNTLLNDITQIRSYLEQGSTHISLKVNRQNGYYFIGKGIDVLHFLYALINQIFQSTNKVFLHEITATFESDDNSKVLLSYSFREHMYKELQNNEDKLSKTFVEKDLLYAIKVFPYFILALRKLPHINIEKELGEVFEKIEYPVAANIMYHLSAQFDIEFSLADIYFATLMLLSIRKNYDGHIGSPVYKNLHNNVMLFIHNFEQESGIQLDNKNKICEQLVTHLKTLLYRKKYHVFSLNPLTTQIKQQYKFLYNSISTCSKILAEKLDIQFTEDDIAYISIHFGGILRDQQKQLSENNIILITDEGNAVQQLIIKQCERYLSRVNFVAIVSRVEELPVNLQYDFAITTYQDVKIDKPFVTVNPIFQFNDILLLLKYSKDNQLIHHNLFNRVDHLLQNHLLDADIRHQLTQDILHIFDESIGYPKNKSI